MTANTCNDPELALKAHSKHEEPEEAHFVRRTVTPGAKGTPQSVTVEGVVVSDAIFGDVNDGGPNWRGLGWIRASVLLCKVQIGLGVLGIPSILSTLGLGPGIILIAVIGAWTTAGGIVIQRFKLAHPEVYGMPDIGYIIGGPWGREIFGVIYWLMLTSVTGAGFLSIATAFNAMTANAGCTAVWALVGAVLTYAVSAIRTLDRISWLGWVGLVGIMASVITLTIAVGVQDRPSEAPSTGPWDPQVVNWGTPSFLDAMSAVATIVFSFAGLPNFVNIMSEMKRPEDFKKSLFLCNSVVISTYLIIGSVVYHFCGIYVASPALGSAGDLLKKVCYGIALPGLIIGCVLNNHLPAKTIFLRLMKKSKHLNSSSWQHWAVWLSCVLFNTVLAYVIAESIPFFDSLLSLIGALLSTFMCLTVPGLILLHEARQRARYDRSLRFYAILAGEVFLVVLTTFMQITGTVASGMAINDQLEAGDTTDLRPMPPPKDQILASDTGNGDAKPAKKKRKAEVIEEPAAPVPAPESPAAPTSLLSVDETASFFTTPEGLARFCGSTSGLPLLQVSLSSLAASRTDPSHRREATRRLSRLQPAATAAKEPDWAWLTQLLNSGRPAGTTTSPSTAGESPAGEHEFFPGREVQPKGEHDAHNLILELIPVDLLGVLIHLFFEYVHPQWPILHVPTFLKSTHKWKEPAFAALVLSMCMLASRYCADPRVRAQPDNPASAGYQYHATFRKLREIASLGSDDAVEAIVSLFFASQYHCVGAKLPGLGDAVELEIRKRTAWAIYCYDKSLAGVAGRPPLMPLAYFDVAMPAPFPPVEGSSPTNETALTRDASDCETFAQLVLVSAVMEKSIAACMQPPHFENPILLRLSGTDVWKAENDMQKPAEVEKMLDDWASQLPPSLAERDVEIRAQLPSFSPRNETVFGVEQTCRIILSSRRLQLVTAALVSVDATDANRVATLRVELRKHRLGLLNAIKQLVSSGVKLGAGGLLNRCDIYLGYRLLLAGRLTLAICLSAQEDADATQEVQALQTLEACILLLKAFANAFPISLGAAETLKETCRVCNITLSKTTLETSSHGRYAWHRPLPKRGVTVMQPVRAAPAEVPFLTTRETPSSQATNPSPPVFPPFAPLPSAADFAAPIHGFGTSSSPNAFSGGSAHLSASSAFSAGPVSDSGLEAWAGLLGASPGAPGGPSVTGTPAAFSGFGDLSDLSWLYPGGIMPQL
ncbi:hypothetical protein JCM10207_009121 [Rhodosporidiobolus poonsookiae]